MDANPNNLAINFKDFPNIIKKLESIKEADKICLKFSYEWNNHNKNHSK